MLRTGLSGILAWFWSLEEGASCLDPDGAPGRADLSTSQWGYGRVGTIVGFWKVSEFPRAPWWPGQGRGLGHGLPTPVYRQEKQRG